MTEAPRPNVGGTEAMRPRDGYSTFLANQQERLARRPETAAVGGWFKERVAALPEMRTSETALTGKGGWSHEMTPEGNVDHVKGAFFKIPGLQIEIPRPDGTVAGWTQPGIVQNETDVTLPTPEGTLTFRASGFVAVVDNGKEGDDRRVLLTVGQEPMARTDKKALVRTPVQTSAAKLEAVLAGDSSKDPNMAAVLESVGNGRPASELFASGDIETFPLAPADPNRIEATNVGMVIKVEDEAVQAELEKGGANRWCTLEEARALNRAGLMNGHTAAALFAA